MAGRKRPVLSETVGGHLALIFLPEMGNETIFTLG